MTEKTLFKGASIIDGTGEGLRKADLLIEGKNILEIGNLSIDNAKSIVDLSGKIIMPGLINAHVHVNLDGDSPDPATLISKETTHMTTIRSIRNLEKLLRSGVTYFRDMGGRDYIDIDLRNARNQGLINGPEFLVSGKCLTMTGGHGWFMGRECDGVDEVRKAAREQLKAGADIIKIMATGGIMTAGVEPGAQQLNFDELRAAIEEANKAGKKTATHAQGSTGIMNAVRAGIDSVEHGIFLTDEVIELMLKNGTYLVPTLVAPYAIFKGGVEAGIPAYAVEKTKASITSHNESFAKAYKAGVKIAMGTDAGTPLNKTDMSCLELKLMMDAGASAMDVILFSTRNAANLLGIDAQYGTLEKGKIADFIVLDEDPLKDIGAIQNKLHSVYKHGKLVE